MSIEAIKPAETQAPLLSEIKNRWSPRAFLNTSLEKEKLFACFEAARWAPSCRNEQPTRFIAGTNGDNTWQRIFDTLDEFNQLWCKDAPVLILVATSKYFDYNGKENAHCRYDAGQAAMSFVIEAANQGLFCHQMAGFDFKGIEKAFAMPNAFEAVAVMAVGYIGNPNQLPEKYKDSETAKRTRKKLTDILFNEQWGNAFNEFE